MPLTLTCSAFSPGARIPRAYTGQGRDMSPPLQWMEVPEKTKAFALIVDDPDAPDKIWTHWVLFNIPAEERELAEDVAPEDQFPNGIRQGTNDFGRIGYGGPAPPPGEDHRYMFHLYALDAPLDLPPGCDKDELLDAMKGHIVEHAKLTGTYSIQPEHEPQAR